MHILQANKLSNKVNLNKKEAINTKNDTIKNNCSKSNTLSFMSIPSIAFMGKYLIPVMPQHKKLSTTNFVQLEDSLKFKLPENQLKTNYTVLPQDPLVTKVESYTISGMVKPGPENHRIKIIDESNPAQPAKNGEYKPAMDSPQFDRVNAFVFAENAVSLYEKALGRNLSWAFEDKQVKIFPRAGVKANAYYNRWGGEIKLFYYQNRFKKDETCYTAKMADIITHETGHAIMDSMRPTYATWGYYAGGIHEGFGDSTAMLVALQNENIIDTVIKQTGGDLKKENMVASIAEQFGNSLRKDRAMYLRNAINKMKLSDFETGKAEKEVHVLGHLLNGVFYDMYVEMTNKNKESMTIKDAMITARDNLTKLHARAMADYMPVANVYVEDFAKAYLKADKMYFEGRYSEMLKDIFLMREILNKFNINDWEKDFQAISALKINMADMKSNRTLEMFVNSNKKELKVPLDNRYEVETAYNNAEGETFVHLKAPREIELPIINDDNNKAYGIEVFDVMSLGFNKNGDLFYKSVKNTRRRGIKDAIEEATTALKSLKNKQTSLNWTPDLSPVYKKSKNSNILIKPPRF